MGNQVSEIKKQLKAIDPDASWTVANQGSGVFTRSVTTTITVSGVVRSAMVAVEIRVEPLSGKHWAPSKNAVDAAAEKSFLDAALDFLC